jgi:hypothetical protein
LLRTLDSDRKGLIFNENEQNSFFSSGCHYRSDVCGTHHSNTLRFRPNTGQGCRSAYGSSLFHAGSDTGTFCRLHQANIFVGAGPYDIIFGSAATLLAAWLTHKMPVKYLAPLPPVIVNGVIVAAVLKFSINAPFLVTMGFVALGELIACYGLGYPLIVFLEKHGLTLKVRNAEGPVK